MTSLITYTLTSFSQIENAGFNYVIPPEIIEKLNKIAAQVGNPSYIKTPSFIKVGKAGGGGGGGGGGKARSAAKPEENWETLRTFQPTKLIEKEKECVGAKLDEIRFCINKMSVEKYPEVCAQILETMSTFQAEDMEQVGNSLFEIASSNRFFSKLYADLYTTLIHHHGIMKTKLLERFANILELFRTIEYVEPEKNYDLFCKITKNNDKRKALCFFFVNLAINGVLEPEQIFDIITSLMDMLTEFISIPNKKNEVDEIAENIDILYNKELFEIEEFIQQIKEISEYKIKDYPSLTKKTQFKFMDLIDKK
jgi:hypothetical protein